jgi:hypothetical protein
MAGCYAHQAALRDTKVVDVFAPPREDFLAWGARHPIYVRRSPASYCTNDALNCKRFTLHPFVRFGLLWTYHDRQLGDSEWPIASFI